MDEINPYQRPSTTVSEVGALATRAFPVAGKTRRFFNFVIDLLCFYAFFFVLAIIVFVIFGDEAMAVFEGLRGLAISMAVYLGYYTLMEGTFSFTIGKLITGTRVVSTDQSKSRFLQAFVRALCRHIPFEPFSLLASDENIAWHDSIAKTKVVCIR